MKKIIQNLFWKQKLTRNLRMFLQNATKETLKMVV